MQTADDIAAKLAEISSARAEVKEAEDKLAEAECKFNTVSWSLFEKAREIVNNIVERACCSIVNNIVQIDDESLRVEYTYCCGDNEGGDIAVVPSKYFFMNEDVYIADAKLKTADGGRAKMSAEEKAEYELYLKLKKKFEQDLQQFHITSIWKDEYEDKK